MGWEATRAASPVKAEGCQTMKTFCLSMPAARKNSGQSRPGALAGKSAGCHGVIGVVDVFAVGEGDLGFGDGGFEGEDAGGAGVGIGDAG